jgi:hypothetical protein
MPPYVKEGCIGTDDCRAEPSVWSIFFLPASFQEESHENQLIFQRDFYGQS